MKPEDSQKSKRKIPFNAQSAVGWAGVACLSYGCWLAWQPLGFIAGGALAILVALFSPVEG